MNLKIFSHREHRENRKKRFRQGFYPVGKNSQKHMIATKYLFVFWLTLRKVCKPLNVQCSLKTLIKQLSIGLRRKNNAHKPLLRWLELRFSGSSSVFSVACI